MKKKKDTVIKMLGLCLIFLLSGCKSGSDLVESSKVSKVTGPQVVIYKTKDNYFQHVPVNLSADKKSLISYPAPSDVLINGDLAYPEKLENGYLLDKRGINEGCAFLKWTYYEYSRLDHTPSHEELMKMILDNDPLTEMYYCGKKSDYKDLLPELNQIIMDNQLRKFKRIK
ncbi:MAG: hypothetical protein HGA37_08850 [Lentimicrobium sp.]|nr:hypothetical protein [Lentimicrobium sp.]